MKQMINSKASELIAQEQRKIQSTSIDIAAFKKSYKDRIKRMDELMASLPVSCRDDGSGYTQQKKEIVEELSKLVLKEADKLSGRVLCENRGTSLYDSFLYEVWHKLCCIDNKYRDWGNPYYALHPNENCNTSCI